MKQFIKQIIYFGFTLLIIIGAFALINSNFKKKVLAPDNFRLPDSSTILIIGDSEIGLCLNPKLIPHSNNQSIIGEHYLYTYTRLKFFLENNPQLESVLLGFSYPNIAKKYDMRLSDSRDQSWYFEKEFMLLDKNELKNLYFFDILFFRNYMAWEWGFPTKENIILIWKSFFGNLNQESLPYIGFFTDEGTVSNVGNAKERIAGTIGDDESEYGIASLQMEYLNLIFNLCRIHNVRLTLFSSPLSKYYYDLIPEFYISRFEKITKELPNNVSFMDYTNYPLPDSCFYDSNHLNRLGAEIISQKVADELASLKK